MTTDWKSSSHRCLGCYRAKGGVRQATDRHLTRPDWEEITFSCTNCGHNWSQVRLGPARREDEAKLHAGLCYKYAHQYRRRSGFRNRSDEADEFFAVAYAGLADGLSRYDPSKVNPKSGRPYQVLTYCGYWIVRYLKTHLRDSLGVQQTERRRRLDLSGWRSGTDVLPDAGDALERFAQYMADAGRVVAGIRAEDDPAVIWDDEAWDRVCAAIDPADREVCRRNVRLGEKLTKIGAGRGVSKSMAGNQYRRLIRRLREQDRDWFDDLTEQTRARQAV